MQPTDGPSVMAAEVLWEGAIVLNLLSGASTWMGIPLKDRILMLLFVKYCE